MNIRKNDNVLVIAGKDKGKKGKVRLVSPKHDRITVDGVNLVKKHARAAGKVRQAGIIEREQPMHVSNVRLLCNRCNRPTRVSSRVLEDGKKVRICRSCQEVID